jgi:hypothetical protein
MYSIRLEDRKVIHAELLPDVEAAIERGLCLRQELSQVDREV